MIAANMQHRQLSKTEFEKANNGSQPIMCHGRGCKNTMQFLEVKSDVSKSEFYCKACHLSAVLPTDF